MVKFIWYNIILGVIVNLFIAPIAYLFRNKVKVNSFLWGFLTDNTYGDDNWRPKLKNKFLRAYFWMLRNPRQNWYWKDYIDSVEWGFKGFGKVKSGNNIITWRTMLCLDTDDWHGKILNFNSPLWGTQNITFKRADKEGNIINCYKKSTCIPYHIGPFILVIKRRSGHGGGLVQYNFTFPLYSYKKNKDGWKVWKSLKWKTITI